MCTNLLHATSAGDSWNSTIHASTPYLPFMFFAHSLHHCLAQRCAGRFLLRRCSRVQSCMPCSTQVSPLIIVCVCVHSITWRGVDSNPGRICSFLLTWSVVLPPWLSSDALGVMLGMLQGGQYLSHNHVSERHCGTLE